MKLESLQLILASYLISLNPAFGALNPASLAKKVLSPMGSRSFSVETPKSRVSKASKLVETYQSHIHDPENRGKLKTLEEYFKVGREAAYAYIKDYPELSSDQQRLVLSIESNNEEKVKQVLDTGIDVNFKDHRGITPLHRASSQGNSNIVKALIQKGAEVNKCGLWKSSNLQSWLRDMDVARPFFRHDKFTPLSTPSTCTPLHVACIFENADVVLELLRSNANVNGLDASKRTPMHYVESVEIAKILIQHGADVQIRDMFGNVPLDYIQNWRVHDYLMELGKDE